MSSEAIFSVINTADGPFSMICETGPDGAPIVLASGWTESAAELTGQIHPSLRPEVITEDEPPASVAAAVADYYAGDPEPANRVQVRQASGPFREHAWQVLRGVRAGETITYTEYAARTGHPGAVRAAASACASNAVALFVPCHRVLRQDGSLGGFRWGMSVKERLLNREREQR